MLFLVENGATVDAKNSNMTTPFFNSVEGLHRGISQVRKHNNAANSYSLHGRIMSRRRVCFSNVLAHCIHEAYPEGRGRDESAPWMKNG